MLNKPDLSSFWRRIGLFCFTCDCYWIEAKSRNL